jgi:hypothetical protein
VHLLEQWEQWLEQTRYQFKLDAVTICTALRTEAVRLPLVVKLTDNFCGADANVERRLTRSRRIGVNVFRKFRRFPKKIGTG